VNARDEHEFLEAGKDFSTWIKDRIDQYGFVEGRDYLLTKIGEQLPSGTKYRKEYYLTLDMAKELAMVERNEKGKQARQYFIECERRAKQAASDIPAALSNPHLLRQLLAGYTEKVVELETMVQEQKPMIEAYERIADTSTTLCLRDTAKNLQIRPTDLTRWLVANKWIYHRPGKSGYLAYQDRIQAGFLVHKSTPIKDVHTGEERISEQVRVTGKGLTKLAREFSKSESAA
jgi:anti-repressor protein